MILNRMGLLAIPVSLTLTAAPAWADVMEIDDNGARWITGEAIVVSETQVAEIDAQLFELSADFQVPPQAIAEAANMAGLVPAQYLAKVYELSHRFDISPILIEALVWQESRWRVNALSPVGARGLAQLMPGTARDLGVNPDDPFANLEGGARYLREQLDRFDGNLESALAAYNAGPGRVIRAGGVPNIRETKHYVAAIMGRLSNYSRSAE